MDYLAIEEAERLHGKRLDRRRKYFLWDDRVCVDGKFTNSCSGCFESGEYGQNESYYEYDKKSQCHVGAGCSECGYTGKRVNHFPCPVEIGLQ